LVAEAGSLEAQSLYQVLRVPLSQLMSAVEISRQAAVFVPAADLQNEQTAALDLAWELWEVENQIDLVQVEQAAPPPSDDWTGGNPYNQASPGILVQFAIIGLITSAQILVLERQTRTLHRMRTTDMQPWAIIAGHVLAMFALVFLQILLLVVFGQLVLGVDYLHAPLSTLLVSLALSLWVAAMGLLIGLLAKEEQQVILYSMIAMFVFSSLGGTWFPLEASGGTFAAIGRLLPSAWAMTGYQNILIRGLGTAAAWKPVLVLLAYALGFFGLAAWRLRKMTL
jgi:ABC-type multidrug transport system permease subunit